MRPIAFAPFAGTYVLGASLSRLNKYRGVPTVGFATQFLNNATDQKTHGVHLEQFDLYDCATQTVSKNGKKFEFTQSEYVQQISTRALDFDDDTWDDFELDELIAKAYERFSSKANEINFTSDTCLVIRSDKVTFRFGTNCPVEKISRECEIAEPFVRIDVNHNLLHRLLRGPRYAHWNNAEIGSHLKYFRKPNIFERGLYHCMCFLHA